MIINDEQCDATLIKGNELGDVSHDEGSRNSHQR